jgi:hypothetical protein
MATADVTGKERGSNLERKREETMVRIKRSKSDFLKMDIFEVVQPSLAEQGSASYGLWAKSSRSSVFVWSISQEQFSGF